MTTPRYRLQSHVVGPLPIINAFLDRLGVDARLARTVPADPRARMAPAAALGVVLRSVIESRGPLYALGAWVAERDRRWLARGGLATSALVTDDRVGRALERLFDADRAVLQTALVLQALQRFAIDTAEFHNDSTSLTVTGVYAAASGTPRRGAPTAAIRHGHSKDHRPDLKQLLWILTVAADGAVPVHYRVADGNTEDSTTHRATWDRLCRLTGRADFLYVADAKLCTQENLRHITDQGGHFLTVLPCARKEDRDFRAWIQTQAPDWALVRHQVGRDGQADDYLMTEAPWPSADGYRVAWVLSTAKARRDADSRRARIAQAATRLAALRDRLLGPKARIRTRAGAPRAGDPILADTGDWIAGTLEPETEPRYRQAGPGRPGASTAYRRAARTRLRLTWTVRTDRVAFDAKSDGMFPLITDRRDLTLGDLLDRYKYQPCLERRHEQLKSGLRVTPMWLKNVDRIEAFLVLDFVALLVRALLEREVRRRMQDADLATLPIYPEDRPCAAPTAERILTLFASIQRHELLDARGRVVQTFEPTLTRNQCRLLRLLGLSPSIYASPA